MKRIGVATLAAATLGVALLTAVPARGAAHAAPAAGVEQHTAAAGQTGRPAQGFYVEGEDTAGVAGHAETAAGHGEAEAHSPGLIGRPTEGLVPALTTLVVFAVLMAVLGKYAWGPISTGLKAREDKIRKDIEDAERARADADKARADYETQIAGAEERVRAMIAKAQQDGNDLAARIRAQAQQEAEEAKDRATREIESARKQAVADVREQAATLSVAIAEKILRRNLNESDQHDLVRAGLDEMDAIGSNGHR